MKAKLLKKARRKINIFYDKYDGTYMVKDEDTYFYHAELSTAIKTRRHLILSYCRRRAKPIKIT